MSDDHRYHFKAQRPVTPPAPTPSDASMLGRVMASTSALEVQVHAMEKTLERQSEALGDLKLSEREISTTKKIGVGILTLLIPAVLAGVVQAIQNSERQRQVEVQVTNAATRAESAERSAGEIRTEVRVLTIEAERQRQTTERLLDTIQRIESPTRRTR